MGRAIEIKGSRRPSRAQLTLKISSERQPTAEIPVDSTNGTSVTNLFDERSLVFQYRGSAASKQVESRIRMNEQGFEVNQPVTNVPFLAIILLSQNQKYPRRCHKAGKIETAEKGRYALKSTTSRRAEATKH